MKFLNWKKSIGATDNTQQANLSTSEVIALVEIVLDEFGAEFRYTDTHHKSKDSAIFGGDKTLAFWFNPFQDHDPFKIYFHGSYFRNLGYSETIEYSIPKSTSVESLGRKGREQIIEIITLRALLLKATDGSGNIEKAKRFGEQSLRKWYQRHAREIAVKYRMYGDKRPEVLREPKEFLTSMMVIRITDAIMHLSEHNDVDQLHLPGVFNWMAKYYSVALIKGEPLKKEEVFREVKLAMEPYLQRSHVDQRAPYLVRKPLRLK